MAEISKPLSHEKVLFVSNSSVLSNFIVAVMGFSVIYLSNDPIFFSEAQFVVGAMATSFLNSYGSWRISISVATVGQT